MPFFGRCAFCTGSGKVGIAGHAAQDLLRYSVAFVLIASMSEDQLHPNSDDDAQVS